LRDEPFSRLDRELRAMLQTELASLRRQLQLTAIYVTHDLEDAETWRTERSRFEVLESTPEVSGS
jgi:ABC-type Fe3+/spermidine/putrescine transport system ATPase subunit